MKKKTEYNFWIFNNLRFKRDSEKSKNQIIAKITRHTVSYYTHDSNTLYVTTLQLVKNTNYSSNDKSDALLYYNAGIYELKLQ